jgi:hypothetical protein
MDPSNSPERIPFKYIGGDSAIDLVNTIDWTRRGPEQERLTSYERLTRWAEEAGVLSARNGASLRSRAAAKPKDADAALNSVLRARDVLHRVFVSCRTAHDRANDGSASVGTMWRPGSIRCSGRCSGRRLRWSAPTRPPAFESAMRRTVVGCTSTGAGTGSVVGVRWKPVGRGRNREKGAAAPAPAAAMVDESPVVTYDISYVISYGLT